MILNKNRKQGFTLIELLVVISIIGLLSSVIFASLNSARAKSRNARRLSDIHTLVNAFYLSLGSSGSFQTGGWYCVSATCYDALAVIPANTTLDAFLAPSLPTKPADPVGGTRGFGGYMYLNPLGATVSVYDGYVFSTGVYLEWFAEPPVVANVCGPGRIYNATANYIQCLLQLDN